MSLSYICTCNRPNGAKSMEVFVNLAEYELAQETFGDANIKFLVAVERHDLPHLYHAMGRFFNGETGSTHLGMLYGLAQYRGRNGV